jgi:putative DNA primase/helicase
VKGIESLRELRPDDYALTRLPVAYDSEAKCTEWTTFVDEVVESGKVATFQEYVGYTLHRGGVPFNKALLLVGDGANGKSTALNVIRAMLGEENTRSKQIQDFSEAKHIADLHGAIANIHADLSEGTISANGISKFKNLTGGDSMEGRYLYEQSFRFKPTAKHLYAANTTPDVGNYVGAEDSAWWRRWIVIHFPRYFRPEERDRTLESRLTSDEALSGILNWAIEGWNRLTDQYRFTNEDTTGDTRRRWLTWGDSAEQFIETCIEPDPDAENRSTGEVYEVYEAWCRGEGEDPIGQQSFTSTLRDAPVNVGYSTSVHLSDNRSSRNGYKSLGFTDEAPSSPQWKDGNSESDGDRHTDTRATGLNSFGGSE